MTYNQTATPIDADAQESNKHKKTYNRWLVDGAGIDDVSAWLKTNYLQLPRPMSERARRAAQSLMKKVYRGVLKPEYPILRVATIRVKPEEEKLVSGPTRWTAYHPRNRHQYTDHATVNHVRDMGIAQESSIIAEEFLKCTGCGALLKSTVNFWKGTHRAFCHIDTYPARSYADSGFHKDTWGYTFMVGLMYLNPAEISGPDIIRNPHRFNFVADYKNKRYVPDVRPDPMLPAVFLVPIKKIIEDNEAENMQIIEAGNIPRFGMVSFVDELVHHSTPAYPLNTPDICGIDDGTGWYLDPTNITDSRTRTGLLPGDENLRTFVRVWITFVPNNKDDHPGALNDTRVNLHYRA